MPVPGDAAYVLSGRSWAEGTPGTPVSLTYRFPTGASEYLSVSPAIYFPGEEPYGTVSALDGAQRAMAVSALQSWKSVANITLTETFANDGNLRFAFTNQDMNGALAHAYFPESSLAGDIWLNADYKAAYFTNMTLGSDGYETLIHEIGHGLGLKHPFSDAPSGGSLPGGANSGFTSELATTKYTVMAYADYSGAYTGGSIFGGADFMPTTPMLLDIAAMQYLYGANLSYHAGNDTYVFTQGQQYYETIWDAGGVDTFQWNGSNGSEIDLRAGEFSQVGNAITFHGTNAPAAQLDTVAIAFNVTIENAIGGAGADTIYGNQAANEVDGGNGADRIDGYGGNDSIQGGLDNDSYRIRAGGGLDTIVDSGGSLDTLVVADGTVRLRRSGDDLYALVTGLTEGAVFRGYFTASDKPFEQVVFVAGDAWTGGTVWNTSLIASNIQVNSGPVVSAPAVKNLQKSVYAGLDSFLAVSDGQGDAAIRFEVRDSTATAGGGLLYYGGTQAQGATLSINATTLAGVYVQGGVIAGHDVIEVRAYDGLDWGAWASFDLTTRAANVAPVVMPTTPVQGVAIGGSVLASTLFGVVDPEGDTITQYEFYDYGAGAGVFKLNGVTQTAFTAISVSAANLSNLSYHAGATTGSETLYVRAYDGEAWSDWKSWTEQSQRVTNVLPVINAPAVKNTTQGTYTNLSTFVSATDADGDAMALWEVRDATSTAGSGLLYFGGLRPQGETMQTTDLASIYVQGGVNQGHDNIEVRANDGYGWTNWKSIDLNTRLPNVAPVVTPTAATQGVAIGSSVLASTLFGVTDANSDTITQYEFYDYGAGAGVFKLNGVTQTAFTAIGVNAANLSNLSYHAGATTASETLYVRAYDGEAWSDWKSWTEQSQRVTNVLPVINAPAVKNTTQSTYTNLSTFVSVTDADGDAMVSFEVRDATSTAGSGLLYAAGIKPQGATVTVSDLASVYVQGGANQGHDTIEIRANDGYGWTNWKSIDLNTRLPNVAPVVTPTAATQGVAIGSSVLASTLFGVTDANSDTITQYEFYDYGAGAGVFKLNGVTQTAFSAISVSAANLSNLSYHAGATTASETLYVRAYDGEAWSDWKSWTEQSQRVTNVLPVINAPAVKNTTQSTYTNLSTFVSVTDADGDAVAMWEVRDATSTANSGLLYAGGIKPQGATVQVTDLSTVYVQGGVNQGHDTIEIRANDGYGWTNWKSIDLNTRLPNVAPVVTPTAATQGVAIGSSVLASTLFGVTDANSDTMTQYEFYDYGAGAGVFKLNGVTQTAFTAIGVSAANLSNLSYHAGAATGSETLYVRAYDGEAWSDWKSWTEQSQRVTNVLPVINAPAVKNTTQSTYTNLSTFVSVTDADGDAMVSFEVRDATSAAGSGLLYSGGLQAQGATVTVSDLASVYVQGGANQGHDNIEIRANDGYGWTNWKSIDLNTRAPNVAPVVTPTAATQGVAIGSSVLASTLFGVTDANSDAITQYEFYDYGAGAGVFKLNGVTQTAFTAISVSAANLSNLSYHAGAATGSETLYVRAYDGEAWSDWKSWTEQSQRVTNVLPVINAPAVKNTTQSTYTNLSTFVSATDGDGDAIVSWQVRDATSTAGSGLLYSGGLQAQGTTVTVSDLASVYVQGGANQGHDTLEIRANDGYGWTNWTSIDLNTRLPNVAPVVTPTSSTQGVTIGNSVLASTLFGVTDANSDTITQYEFYDYGAGAGVFKLNGVTQTAFSAISVSAANLSNLSYHAGATTGSETLYVRAYDGEAWSDWKSWTEQTLRGTNTLPVITAPAVKPTNQGLYTNLTTFVTVSDADSDPIVSWQVRDLTSTAGSGLLYSGGLQAQGSTVTVTDLSTVYVQGGANLGHDTIEIRANDGYGWTDWKSIDLNTRPALQFQLGGPSALATAFGHAAPVKLMFDLLDGYREVVEQYQVYDAGVGGGYFRLNGTQLAAQQYVTLNAADLNNLFYVGGPTFAGEAIYLRAYDGINWTDWKSWSMTSSQVPALTEQVGTRGNNFLGGGSNYVAYGLSGNDSMTSSNSGNPQNPSINFLAGGAGDDTYNVSFGSQFTYIVEDGAGFDTLNAGGFFFNTTSAAAAIINNDHLALLSIGGGISATIIFNWQDPTRRIEDWVVGGVHYNFDQFRATVLSSSNLQTLAYSQLGVDGGLLETEIAYLTLRGRELDVNHAPVVASAGQTVYHNSTVQLSTLFSATDADGSGQVQSYEITDLSAGGGSVRLFNGTIVSSGVPTYISPNDLGLTQFLAPGMGQSDTLRIRAFDGSDWSAPVDITINPANRAPTAAYANPGGFIREGVARNPTIWVNASDADGDAITAYEFTDAGTGGRFRINGVDQAQGATVVVQTADMGNAYFLPGAAGVQDSFSVRVFDGLAWSNSANVTMIPQVNHAPVLTVTNRTVRAAVTSEGVSQSIQMSTLYTATDPDGGPVPFLTFTDNGAGGGAILVNGVAQANGVEISSTTSATNVVYQAGSAPDSETLTIWVSDGGLSATQNVTVTTILNDRPIATGHNAAADVGTVFSTPQMFGQTDSNPFTLYQWRAPTDLALSGGLGSSTIVQSGGGVTTYQNNLGGLSFLAGTANRDATLEYRVYDGVDWSEWATGTLAVRGGEADTGGNSPQTAQSLGSNPGTQTFHGWVGSTDNQDWYRFSMPTGGSVHFDIGGVDQNALVNLYRIDGSGNTNYHNSNFSIPIVGGSGSGFPGSATRDFFAAAGDYVAVVERSGAPGTYYDFSVSTEAEDLPDVVPFTMVVAAGGTLTAFDLFRISDANGDYFDSFGMQHLSGGGSFMFGNTPVGAAGNEFNLSYSSYQGFSQLEFHAGATAGTDTITARVNDGHVYGPWQTWTITTLAPGEVPDPLPPALPGDAAGNTLATGRAIILNPTTPLVFTDHIGGSDTADIYTFSMRSGGVLNFSIDNVGANGNVMAVLYDSNGRVATQYTNLQAIGDAPSGQSTQLNLGNGDYSIRVFGHDTDTTYRLSVRGPAPNDAPVVTAKLQPTLAGQTYLLSQLVQASDAEGDAILGYQITDLGAGGGVLYLNGVAQTAGSPVYLSAAQFASPSYATYVVGALGNPDTLRVRVEDPGGFGPTFDRVITPRASNTAPEISSPIPWQRPALLNSAHRLSEFFSVTDADGDAIARFEIRDLDNAAANSAYLWFNGAAVAQGSTLVVNVGDLQNVWVYGAQADAVDTFTVRADDGAGYGSLGYLELHSRAVNAAPVVTANDLLMAPNTSRRVMPLLTPTTPDDLFVIADADDQYQVIYRFRDEGAGGGYFTVDGVVQQSGTDIDIDLSNLWKIYYTTGAGNGTETIRLQVFDGIAWSGWAEADLQVAAPLPSQVSDLDAYPTLSATPQTFRDWVGWTPTADLTDTYWFTLTSAQTVHVEVSGITAEYGVNFGLNDIMGASVEVGNPTWPYTTIYRDGLSVDIVLSAGDYRFWINTPQSPDNTYYDLTLFTDGAGNSIGSARSVTLGSTVQTFSESVGQYDAADFYTFTLAGNSPLTMELSAIANGSSIQYHLYKSDGAGGHGASLLTFDLSGNGTATPVFGSVVTPGLPLYVNSLVGGNAALSVDLDAGTYYLAATPLGGTSTSYSLGLSNVIPPFGGGSTPGGTIVPTGAVTTGGTLALNSAVLQGTAQTVHTFSLGSLSGLAAGVTVQTANASVQLGLFSVNGNGQLGTQIQGALQNTGNQFTLQSSGAIASGNYALVVTGSQATNYNLTLSGS